MVQPNQHLEIFWHFCEDYQVVLLNLPRFAERFVISLLADSLLMMLMCAHDSRSTNADAIRGAESLSANSRSRDISSEIDQQRRSMLIRSLMLSLRQLAPRLGMLRGQLGGVAQHSVQIALIPVRAGASSQPSRWRTRSRCHGRMIAPATCTLILQL